MGRKGIDEYEYSRCTVHGRAINVEARCASSCSHCHGHLPHCASSPVRVWELGLEQTLARAISHFDHTATKRPTRGYFDGHCLFISNLQKPLPEPVQTACWATLC